MIRSFLKKIQQVVLEYMISSLPFCHVPCNQDETHFGIWRFPWVHWGEESAWSMWSSG